jgi:hypothetical protein
LQVPTDGYAIANSSDAITLILAKLEVSKVVIEGTKKPNETILQDSGRIFERKMISLFLAYEEYDLFDYLTVSNWLHKTVKFSAKR